MFSQTPSPTSCLPRCLTVSLGHAEEFSWLTWHGFLKPDEETKDTPPTSQFLRLEACFLVSGLHLALLRGYSWLRRGPSSAAVLGERAVPGVQPGPPTCTQLLHPVLETSQGLIWTLSLESKGQATAAWEILMSTQGPSGPGRSVAAAHGSQLAQTTQRK